MRQLLLDFDRAPAPTFANFVTGANAELAHALESATRGAFAERVIYVWGEKGAGKTHLLKAFVHALGQSRFVRAAELVDGDLRGVLAIDDVEKLPEERQVALFNAFNERSFAFLLVSAGASPRDVALRRDLSTRLATGLTYRVAPLTDAEKGAALAAHAKTRGFDIPGDVTSYLLTHARRDMGSLIGALDCLDRYSLETGRPITIPLLKAAMQPDLLP
ncbi:MAG TPA: DnaA regulatory inactivator Hda [Usitatibacter sp.]|nr:DnaA regulatory inactivator Hda [Usitatibacter sp.]